MLYRLLGPLEFRGDGGWTGVSAPKVRALLAVLLLCRGRVLSTGQLVDELWGDDPPPAARKLVSGYVLRLRRLTGDPGGRVLVTAAPGYRLLAARGEVDMSRFEELVTAARGTLDALRMDTFRFRHRLYSRRVEPGAALRRAAARCCRRGRRL